MFKYILRQPQLKSKQPKALLMLHGFGSHESDLFSLAHQLPDNLLIISARAPISLDFGGYAWYPIYINAQNQKISDNQKAYEIVLHLSEFIDYLIEKHNIDPNHFNLLGFSQGAILSYALALNYPQKINRVISLSGYINEDIMPLNEDDTRYKHLNFFVSHGIYDDVIPVEWARKTPPYLTERHIQHTYKEYPMGHEVSFECMQDVSHWIQHNL